VAIDHVDTAVLDLGITRLFGQCDLGTTGLISGWSVPEEAHAWNNGPETVFELLTDLAQSRVRMTIEGEPFLAPNLSRQALTLYVNGFRAGRWALSDPHTCALTVMLEPEQLFSRGDKRLARCVWHIPDSMPPAALGQGSDTRQLGFCFRSITLSELN
jgi:hypothetical protein